MISATAAAVTDTKQRRTRVRARALCVAGGALAAAIAWAVEVPLLGTHLTVRFGNGRMGRFGPGYYGHGPFGAGHVQTISIGQVVGISLAAALLGWLLLTILERHTSRARLIWTGTALVALAVSLSLPLAAATTTAAAVGLVVMHLTVGAAVIPAMARTARAR